MMMHPHALLQPVASNFKLIIIADNILLTKCMHCSVQGLHCDVWCYSWRQGYCLVTACKLSCSGAAVSVSRIACMWEQTVDITIIGYNHEYNVML